MPDASKELLCEESASEIEAKSAGDNGIMPILEPRLIAYSSFPSFYAGFSAPWATPLCVNYQI